MTQQELAIVQGPPGTGKTFTSVVALQSLVQTFGKRDTRVPIIVAAETNHALDQLLASCMSTFEASIVRLGGRSEDEDVSQRSLFKLRKDSKSSRTNTSLVRQRRDKIQEIVKCLLLCFPTDAPVSAKAFHDEGILSEDQYKSLVDMMEDDMPENTDPIDLWLEHKIELDTTASSHPLEKNNNQAPDHPDVQQEQDQEDERNKLEGEFIPIKFRTGASSSVAMGSSNFHRASVLLAKHSDLYEVKPSFRGKVYLFLRRELVKRTTSKFRGHLSSYQVICDSLKKFRWNNNVRVIYDEGIQVIGCTTTGLTKYRGLISAIKPKVLLIEEAAEAREAKITSALYPSLDQLILVGDHQQLVPQVDVQELAFEPYNFNVSLFQRLVEASLPYSRLSVQRRMISPIREVISVFYPHITDHETVMDPQRRPPVPGMNGLNHWWFDHSFPDYKTATMSRSNRGEAMVIVGFANYLVQNGLLPSQITILSYYKAQLELIEEQLGKVFNNRQGCCAVRTVDGFQGEQNDIILLSLVRSCGPKERVSPGFVENENRAVVALSRAKCGLYVFGNRHILRNSAASVETWGKVMNVFEQQDRIGSELPITCTSHDEVTRIQSADDWHHVSDGGCKQSCKNMCPNGHPCALKCHPIDHSSCRCRLTCDKLLDCGHNCVSFCGEACKCAVSACLKPAALASLAPGLMAKTASAKRNACDTGDRWSPERVRCQDETRARTHARPVRPKSTPMVIRETFIPTKITEEGTRILGTPVIQDVVQGNLVDLSDDPIVQAISPLNIVSGFEADLIQLDHDSKQEAIPGDLLS